MDNRNAAAARYDLKDLADRAGVTPRTVHFYIQQGLLPPAGAPGPGARYSEAFLARLILIRRLQREHLPLAEIRQRLAALDDGAVIELVAASSKGAGQSAPRGTSALEYVRSILAGSVAPASSGSAPPATQSRASWLRELTSPMHSRRAAREEPAAFDLAAAMPAPSAPAASLSSSVPAPGTRSQWDRIVLAPDVELHIRRPLTREQNKRVERLLVAAREILQENEG